MVDEVRFEDAGVSSLRLGEFVGASDVAGQIADVALLSGSKDRHGRRSDMQFLCIMACGGF